MYRETLTLGVVPNKRSFLSMVEAKRQKDCFMEEIRKIKASIVEIVDIDDICENGIVCEMDKVNAIVDKMKNRKIDALFFPFCDFGEEQVVATIASKFTVPILIWGPRDERPNTDEARGRDTQCGMFAATKVLQRYGLKYSYIYNCTTKSEEFLKGYETFIRTAAVLKSLRTLRIAKIGERPVPFMSVMTNEANLIKRFGITTVPISPVKICNRARKILEEKGKEYIKNWVAVIGDSTFLHTGVNSLMNMMYNKATGTVIILDNSTTGMTGHQDHAATGKTLQGDPTYAIDIPALCRAIGVKNVVEVNARDIQAVEKAVKEEIAKDEVSVIITKTPCVLLDKSKKPLYQTHTDKCKKCGMCMKPGCPAMTKNADGTVSIDDTMCTGCGLCASLCKFDAIELVKEGDR